VYHIEWCNNEQDVDHLASFFESNLTTSYISHSELQFGRAVAPDKWSSNLREILRNEIASRVQLAPGANIRIAAAYDTDGLVGLAYVTFNATVPIPFGIIEDIVIDNSKRGQGIGQEIVNWIFQEAKQNQIKRMFLESGKANHAAHHFFQRNGFEQVSIVMMADIDAQVLS